MLNTIERVPVWIYFLKPNVIFLPHDVLYALMTNERDVRADAQEPGG